MKNEKTFYFIFLLNNIPLSFVCLSIRFSTENIMKLKTHMSSDEIIKMFGEPRYYITICGEKMAGKVDTFWKYGDYSSGRASFTFYEKDGKLYLNDYDIDR